MAGTLEINEQAAWMPPGWAFDFTMELVAKALEDEDRALAQKVLSARTETGGYLDLRSSDVRQMRDFTRAVEEAVIGVKLKGPSAFHYPDYFDGFLRSLSELLQMLKDDPRFESHSG